MAVAVNNVECLRCDQGISDRDLGSAEIKIVDIPDPVGHLALICARCSTAFPVQTGMRVGGLLGLTARSVST